MSLVVIEDKDAPRRGPFGKAPAEVEIYDRIDDVSGESSREQIPPRSQRRKLNSVEKAHMALGIDGGRFDYCFTVGAVKGCVSCTRDL
jgi:hypothetical protein